MTTVPRSAHVVVGVDSGGTFTDAVIIAGTSARVVKLPSTPDQPEEAVLAALDEAGIGPGGLVVHGTTVATNTLLERTGAATAFVASSGLADLLQLARGNRPQLYALHPTVRPPLVPPELRFEAPERLTADGAVLRALTAESADGLARQVASAGAESVGVCLLYSFLDSRHEEILATALAQAGIAHTSLSSHVLPVIREYERASTTAVNAYVAPRVASYLSRLAQGMGDRHLRVMASHGGSLPPEEAIRRPAATVLSGPAAGVLGAWQVGRRLGLSRVVTLDMGGTSTDICVCPGEIPVSGHSTIDGLPVALPALAVETVGAGGGSIVRSATGPVLLVGPNSAGALPGPAAYGRGGQAATITDAHLVLGRLPEGSAVLAGRLGLDRRLAQAALSRAGAPIGLDAVATALGAIAVVNAEMERALARVTLEEGHDPREFSLVAYGGCGPLHACELASALGMSRVVIPVWPGAMSALGAATAAASGTASRTPPDGLVTEALWTRLESLARVQAGLMPTEGAAGRYVEMRYKGQAWEVQVPWQSNPGSLATAFAAAHRRRFGYDLPGEPTEIVTARVRVAGKSAASLPRGRPGRGGSSSRQTVVTSHGAIEAVVRDRADFPGGPGPLVLVQPDATTYVPVGWVAAVRATGELVLTRQ